MARPLQQRRLDAAPGGPMNPMVSLVIGIVACFGFHDGMIMIRDRRYSGTVSAAILHLCHKFPIVPCAGALFIGYLGYLLWAYPQVCP